MMHQDVEDLLSPQTKDMYDSLMSLGHIDSANKLVEDAIQGLVEGINHGGYEYISQKIITARNLLIHAIANALEKNTCGKKEAPCDLCIMQARQIMPDVWRPIVLLMKYMERHSGLTMYQIVETFIKKIEADPGVRFEATTGVQLSTLKIIKAPKIEETHGPDDATE